MAEDNSNAEIFVYTEGAVVPIDVVRVRIHPSVTVIPEGTFREQYKLKEVELYEGLVEIGEAAFEKCNALERVSVPSTVTIVHQYAFSGCYGLEEIELSEGLLEIREFCFNWCNSLKHINIPSTVNLIGERSFYMTRISSISLPNGVQNIEMFTFLRARTLKFRVPSLITTIPRGLFSVCICMFSIELSESITDIEVNAFNLNSSLRNIAIPLDTIISGENGGAFCQCTDLKQLFDTEEQIINALEYRFDNLPIHKMIYYQSFNNITIDQLSDVTNMRRSQRRSLRCKLDPSGSQQDCLGMTPLHIMACSTMQNVELYKVLVEKYPENLITEDRWGAIPLLYAVWGDAPDEIIQFLVNSYQSIHPNYALDWNKLVEQLCLGNAATSSIQMLLDVQQDFPDRTIDWHTIIQKAATIVAPAVQADVFEFLAKYSYSRRIDAIGIKQWREDLMLEIEERMLIENGTFEKPKSYILFYDLPKRQRWFDGFNSKLAEYEARYQELKDATTILELVLWKNKISGARKLVNEEGGSKKKMKFEESAIREQSRSRCGADIVIENVLPYLMSGPVDGSSGDMDSDDDGSDSNMESDDDDDNDDDDESSDGNESE